MEQPIETVSQLMEEDATAGWLVTYADLMTLLLTFFVLLFSISSMDLRRFKEAIGAIQVSLGEKAPPVALLKLIEKPGFGDADGATRLETRKKGRKIVLEDIIGLKSQDLYRDVKRFVRQSGLGEHIEVTMKGSKVIIRVTGTILFQSGMGVLNREAIPLIDDIAKIAAYYTEYRMRIEGHTDDQPISTPEFPTNWELSAVRATTVLRYLIEAGISPQRLTATGYGSLIPLAPNDRESNRARNRRVEFVLEKEAQ
ncbi:MAG TPA: hypothetical protein EYP19_16710 [Desulfobacterales bacterium]|nr:hypothetical protein [Desulfobacterales bacterium]